MHQFTCVSQSGHQTLRVLLEENIIRCVEKDRCQRVTDPSHRSHTQSSSLSTTHPLNTGVRAKECDLWPYDLMPTPGGSNMSLKNNNNVCKRLAGPYPPPSLPWGRCDERLAGWGGRRHGVCWRYQGHICLEYPGFIPCKCSSVWGIILKNNTSLGFN